MAKTGNFMFGIDNVTFIDDEYNVLTVDDPQNASLNLTYEVTEHRGGANNDVRASAVHTRNGELSIGTGYVDAKLAQILTGGTITSLETSAASITTACNTLYGSSDTIATSCDSIVINSPSLVKSTDYYIEAIGFADAIVTRLDDGNESAVTFTANAETVVDAERGIGMYMGAGAVSLTVGEKAYFTARGAINSINQTVKFDSNKPQKISVQAVADYNGVRRTIKIPVVQPTGTVQGNSATEFQVQDLTLRVENSSALDELAEIALQG